MKRIGLFFIFCLCISIITGQDRDTPRRGEGVYSFLKRNNRTIGQVNEFIRLNKTNLTSENNLIEGVAYVLPPSAGVVEQKKGKTSGKSKTYVEPLFGEKYKTYEIIDNKLSGACFYLVSGHGGPDCGATANVAGHVLHEDEYAYDIVLRLARCLLQYGATVHIIIQDPYDGIRDDTYLNNSKNETCMGKAISRSQITRLKQQTNEINSLSYKSKVKYQRAIFVHLDSRSKNTQLDVFFYYQNTSQNKTRSLQLAKTMRETFRNCYNTHQPNRGFSGTVSTRPLYVLENTTPVSVFVELANMQNPSDQKRYMLVENRQALANWLCAGFIKDYQSTSH